MEVVSSKNIVHILQRTLNHVDTRLVGHGERVAFIVDQVLRYQGGWSGKKLADLAMLGLLHDIGAFKTEDINRMVEFESQNIWEHSLYGSLFLKFFSPLSAYEDVILNHHLPFYDYEKVNPPLAEDHLAGLLHVADRVDIFIAHGRSDLCVKYLQNRRGSFFPPTWVDCFLQAENELHIIDRLKDGSYLRSFEQITEQVHFSTEEKRQYLSVAAYSIDFRSRHMVLHTVTTVNVSRIIAELMGMDKQTQEEIYFGALLHDIGKVATPIEILEKPGKLLPEEMEIMRQHVVLTGEIIGGFLDSHVEKIAVRHHEKIDGSGYPLELRGERLSPAERIVAVADIISALVRKRSYKEAFDDVRTKEILREMMEDHKICPVVTGTVLEHFDEILKRSQQYGEPMLKLYQALIETYQAIQQNQPRSLAADPALAGMH